MLLQTGRVSLIALTIAAGFVSSAIANDAATSSTIRIVRHSVWSDVTPKGVDARGLRRNLAPGDEVSLGDLTIGLTAATPGVEASKDQATLTLKKGEASETRTVEEGAAFNWQGYHIAIPAMYLAKGELGFGCTVIEAATVESLPERVAQSTTANGAEDRLRVKHQINRLTLHHSATPHNPGDELARKLKNQQLWGARERQWFDVPYHFFVDLDGTVYEGRDYHYAGDTNTRYNTEGHFLVNCFGDYAKAEPNEKQLQSIANLMAWAVLENGIDPITIYGHKDLAETSCPGANLYKYIEDGSLRQRVETIVKTAKPTVVWLDAKPETAPKE